MDLDELLPQVGEFGKYQKLLLWLVCLPACVPCGFCAFNQLFMADVPDHWCRQPQLEGIVDAKQALRLAIPFSVSFHLEVAETKAWTSPRLLFNISIK